MLRGEHSAVLLTVIKQPFVIMIFVFSIFEWPLNTGFNVDGLIKSIISRGFPLKIEIIYFDF